MIKVAYGGNTSLLASGIVLIIAHDENVIDMFSQLLKVIVAVVVIRNIAVDRENDSCLPAFNRKLPHELNIIPAQSLRDKLEVNV